MDIELIEPAKILIEKICNAIGILYEPRYIKKKALAEAEADKIKALSKIEVSEMQKKVLENCLHEEEKKQENSKKIIISALENLNEGADPSKIDEDWIAYFFDKCKIVSNIEMQSLWAKLLATEANQTGSISKKTLQIVSTLDKNDAYIFTNLCSFLITIEDKSVPCIISLKDLIYLDKGITFESLKHLEYLGLISFNSSDGFSIITKTEQSEVNVSYYEESIKFKNLGNNFQSGFVMFTRAGAELAPISGAQKIEEFRNYLITSFKNKLKDIQIS